MCIVHCELYMKDPRYIQLLIAALVVVMGMILLYIGVSIDPKGEIHETVLVAFGEAATFAGSIMGIDYHYKSKFFNNHNDEKDNSNQNA